MTLQVQNAQVQPTTNYLVPSSGATHVVPLSGALVLGQPAVIDWRQFNTDSFPFQPQGMYFDNTQNANKVRVDILAGGPEGALIWSITIDAGQVMHTPFPAPNGQATVLNAIVGGGNISVVFADYPVLPFLFTP